MRGHWGMLAKFAGLSRRLGHPGPPGVPLPVLRAVFGKRWSGRLHESHVRGCYGSLVRTTYDRSETAPGPACRRCVANARSRSSLLMPGHAGGRGWPPGSAARSLRRRSIRGSRRAHATDPRPSSEPPTPGTSERGRATAGSRGTLAVIPSSTCAFAIRNPTRNPGTDHPQSGHEPPATRAQTTRIYIGEPTQNSDYRV